MGNPTDYVSVRVICAALGEGPERLEELRGLGLPVFRRPNTRTWRCDRAELAAWAKAHGRKLAPHDRQGHPLEEVRDLAVAGPAPGLNRHAVVRRLMDMGREDCLHYLRDPEIGVAMWDVCWNSINAAWGLGRMSGPDLCRAGIAVDVPVRMLPVIQGCRTAQELEALRSGLDRAA